MNVPTFQDDINIQNNDVLYRRIPKDETHICWDDNQKRWRPSSAAFEDSSDNTPLSMYLRSVLIAKSRTPADLLANYPNCALAKITVDIVRRAGQGVIIFPDQGEDSHVYIFGNKTDKNRRTMAKAADWEIYTTPPPPGGP